MASPKHLKCDICNTAKLRRMTSLWRRLMRVGNKKLPSDVPPGHVAVLVGEAGRRFVIRADFLNHPIFRQLLDAAYEECGHGRDGPLAVPCDEYLFQDIICSLKRAKQFLCDVEDRLQVVQWKDATRLLQGIQEDRCT